MGTGGAIGEGIRNAERDNARIAAERGKFERGVRDEYNTTLKRLTEILASLNPESYVKNLFDNLKGYLYKKEDDYDFFDAIPPRLAFINDCLDIFTSEKSSELEKYNALEKKLSEENISQFKGWFSKRLYTHFKEYQTFFKSRQQAVGQALSEKKHFPSVLVEIIGEYDKDVSSLKKK